MEQQEPAQDAPGPRAPPCGPAARRPWSGAQSPERGRGGAGGEEPTGRGCGAQPDGEPLRSAQRPGAGPPPQGEGLCVCPQKGRRAVWSLMEVRLGGACRCPCPVWGWRRGETRGADPGQRVSELLSGSGQMCPLLGTMDPTSPASHTALRAMGSDGTGGHRSGWGHTARGSPAQAGHRDHCLLRAQGPPATPESPGPGLARVGGGAGGCTSVSPAPGPRHCSCHSRPCPVLSASPSPSGSPGWSQSLACGRLRGEPQFGSRCTNVGGTWASLWMEGRGPCRPPDSSRVDPPRVGRAAGAGGGAGRRAGSNSGSKALRRGLLSAGWRAGWAGEQVTNE